MSGADIFSLFYISIFFAFGQFCNLLFYELFTNRLEFIFARYLVSYKASVVKQREGCIGAGSVLCLLAFEISERQAYAVPKIKNIKHLFCNACYNYITLFDNVNTAK